MTSIKNGLGPRWRWLVVLFSLGAIVAALGQTAMIQSNTFVTSITTATDGASWAPEPIVIGLVLATVVAAVVSGGLGSIGTVAARLVPLMAVGYTMVCGAMIVLNFEAVPSVILLIFRAAFGIEEFAGGIAGYGLIAAMRAGVARGIASNEAGQGTTPIVHAAAQTDCPTRQGKIAMTGVFIDTLVICTMTALVILIVPGQFASDGHLVMYAWQSTKLEGVEIFAAVFSTGMPGGHWLLTTVVLVFSFTTLISWFYYAEQAARFLIGSLAYRVFWLLWAAAIVVGSVQPIDAVWRLGDLAMVAMTLPNLIAVLALSPVVVALTRATR